MEFVKVDYTENKEITKDWIDQDVYQKKPATLALEDSQLSLAAKVNSQIVGRLAGTIFLNSLHIELLAVNPEQRANGVGGALLKEAIKIAKEKQLHFVYLETMSFNAPKFYLKHGFEVIKEVKNSPLDQTSHFFMFKDIR